MINGRSRFFSQHANFIVICSRQLFTQFVSAAILTMLFVLPCAAAIDPVGPVLQIPEPGNNFLHILSPTVLELVLINTQDQNANTVDSWDWVNDETNFVPPDMSSVRVIVGGQTKSVTTVGFKRRPIYAPQAKWDLRIVNDLYLELSSPIAAGQSVQVLNNGTVWPTNLLFAATADSLRYNPAIHVNQEGYMPAYPKKAMIGYYLGNLGELPISTNVFNVINAQSGASVFQGTLTSRPDVGYQYSPTPYQLVYEADFSSVTNSGQFRIQVPGMGASLPFQIADGVAMDFTRWDFSSNAAVPASACRTPVSLMRRTIFRPHRFQPTPTILLFSPGRPSPNTRAKRMQTTHRKAHRCSPIPPRNCTRSSTKGRWM
jgi:hypothetical protein